MKMQQQSISQIIRTVAFKQPLEQKYSIGSKDSRVRNYQLIETNLSLRKQIQRIKKVLEHKNKEKKEMQSFEQQIANVTKKLKEVFNQSQTLELTLSQIRSSKRSKSKSTSQVVESCCCSRRAEAKKKETSISCQNSTERNGSKLIKMVNCNPQQPEKQYRSQQSQTINTWESEVGSRIQEKKDYLQRLKSILSSQKKVIEQYESSINSNSNVGKITRVGSKSTIGIIKNAFIGSFAKTKRKINQ